MGFLVGSDVGFLVGFGAGFLVGSDVGLRVGVTSEQQSSLEPSSVGQQSPTRCAHSGCAEQEADPLSAFVVGSDVGFLVGGVGCFVGYTGCRVGLLVGCRVGLGAGCPVGLLVGNSKWLKEEREKVLGFVLKSAKICDDPAYRQC